MRVELTVTKTFEMDEARVLSEPGFEPPPVDADDNERRAWLRESFWELCGFDRDKDHVDGKYVWLVREDSDSDFYFPADVLPAGSREGEQ